MSLIQNDYTRTTYLIFAWLAAMLMPAKTEVVIGCPGTRDGKALTYVGLFDGPPENKMELLPEIGYFKVPQIPPEEWGKYPPFYLGCRYQSASDMYAVELPRTIKRCEFTSGPNVKCH